MSGKRRLMAIQPAISGIVRSHTSFNGLRKSIAYLPPLSVAGSRLPRRPAVQTRQYATNNSAAISDPDAKTPLYDLHASYGAKFVPFGGYVMPVQYSDLSVGESHKWTREKASIFDVSHMVQNRLTGPLAIEFLETITPAEPAVLAPFTSTLSALLKPSPREGGIIDDCVIVRLGPEEFYFVTNAGCREKDHAYLSSELKRFHTKHGDAPKWEILEGKGLIALQGPLAGQILEDALAGTDKAKLGGLYFGCSMYGKVTLPTGQSSDLLISRAGYTGEDGFEISIPAEETTAVTQFLLESAGKEKLRLAGLGARDSLRLEAGMCLYGHDLNEDITPPEAALSWIVGKSRREKGGFYGADTINKQILGVKKGGSPIEKRRIGLIVEGAPAREGMTIHDDTGAEVGVITSGCPSPTLGKNIAMGYIKDGMHKSGTEVQVKVRSKMRKATVSKMPFVPSKYHKPAAPPS
ncbi:glycine cleavage system T protein [Pseudovirgaria hyperparasitica]|uniref:Aminomethyltransferase n=1 Tax=Pseudovirgaria hyperparasitica TaxID=470096 RepID=A0A6A6WIV9_9PEZI|nr:glycine cleavage system T protein [Pseudovirgaria hyperparasitica]KAF2762020.1 glycine cleavage system T protein [Pseudovirgaria hyperparasitica]